LLLSSCDKDFEEINEMNPNSPEVKFLWLASCQFDAKHEKKSPEMLGAIGNVVMQVLRKNQSTERRIGFKQTGDLEGDPYKLILITH